MVINAWCGKLLCIVIDSSYHRDLLCWCYHARFGRKNPLLITVIDEVFSLVKISGKLYKSCMCLILSQSRRCLYIALSLSVSACSCVQILLLDSTLTLTALYLGDHKISWVRALIDRILRICTPNKIKTELKLIRKFLSWNGFPKHVANLLIDRFTTNAQKRASDHNANDTSHNNQ